MTELLKNITRQFAKAQFLLVFMEAVIILANAFQKGNADATMCIIYDQAQDRFALLTYAAVISKHDYRYLDVYQHRTHPDDVDRYIYVCATLTMRDGIPKPEEAYYAAWDRFNQWTADDGPLRKTYDQVS